MQVAYKELTQDGVKSKVAKSKFYSLKKSECRKIARKIKC